MFFFGHCPTSSKSDGADGLSRKPGTQPSGQRKGGLWRCDGDAAAMQTKAFFDPMSSQRLSILGSVWWQQQSLIPERKTQKKRERKKERRKKGLTKSSDKRCKIPQQK